MSVEQESDNPEQESAGQRQPVHGILEAFRKNQLSLRDFLSRFMISSHEIEDVTQETFLRAYQVEQERVIEYPKAFLFRIAKNLVLSEFAKKSRKVTDYIEDYEQDDVLGDESGGVEADIMAQQKLGIYCEALASLPPQCRRAVIMRKVYGLSHKEIARRMDIAVSTVEKHLVKGGRECKKIIDERYGKPSVSRQPVNKSTIDSRERGTR